MALFQFFRREKPRQFDHKPRYYDERKERLDKLMADSTQPKTGEDYREHLRQGWAKSRRPRTSANYSPLRVIGLVVLLIALLRYFFF